MSQYGAEFNRRDPTDIVDSGSMQVAWDDAVHLGYPLKEDGEITQETPAPVYTIMTKVTEYTDSTGVAPCCGICDQTIPNGATIEGSSLRNTEFRHLNRDVPVVKWGVRKMKNKGTITCETNMRLAPAPGGFQAWQTGMSYLGVLERGPVATDEDGYVIVDVKHLYVAP